MQERQARIAAGPRLAHRAHHVVTLGQQRVQQVFSDEPARSRQQNPHAHSFQTGQRTPMNAWTTALQRGLVGGAISSVLSTVALAVLGKGEGASAYAPTNAISHWIWEDEALDRHEPNLRHTATG